METRQRILIVEDEPKLVRLLRLSLESDGYEVMVAQDGQTALESLKKAMPALIILDLILPGDMDGYEFCKTVRDFSDVPVIMLTSRARESEKIRGFDCGADDYVTKPFSYAELSARLKAVLHRSTLAQSSTGTTRFQAGDLEIDYLHRRAYMGKRKVHLTATEYNLLHYLATNQGKVLLHEEILEKVWGFEYRDEYQYLRNYVSNLRKKLEPDPRNPRYILSKQGVGYYLNDDL